MWIEKVGLPACHAIEDWRNRPLQGGRYPYIYMASEESCDRIGALSTFQKRYGGLNFEKREMTMEIQRTPEERMRFLAGRAAEVMIQRIQKEIPQRGSFGKISVSFDIPETKNSAMLLLEHSLTGTPDQRRLQIGVRREGTDRLHSNYLMHDTNENIIKYLERHDIIDVLIPYYKMHSEKVDEEL